MSTVPLADVLAGTPVRAFWPWLTEWDRYVLIGHIDAEEAQARIGDDYLIDVTSIEHLHARFDQHASDSCVPDDDGCDSDCGIQPWWIRETEPGHSDAIAVTAFFAD